MSGLSSFISNRSSATNVHDITINDLETYLVNPVEHMKQIRNASTYLANKYGVIKDIQRMFKSLPTLRYNLMWSGEAKSDKHEQLVYDFLDSIKVVRMVRDGLYEVAELGTIVTCLRSKKYVQFLDLDDLKIDKQRDGKWVVEFDLASLDKISDFATKRAKINSLPPEVTKQKYNAYKNKGDEANRYVELKNCDVINIDAKRNSPYGLPVHMGAWGSILQKEIVDKVERSVADRLIKQLIVLSAGWLDKDQTKPVTRDMLQAYFKEVTKLLERKENAGRQAGDTSGTATVALPHWLKLDALDVDTTMFKQDFYEKIKEDVYSNLGVAEALISGKGGTYSSATVNNEKFFSFIFSVVEQFEEVINGYFKLILPKGVGCRIKFDRSTILDKKTDIENKKEIFMQTSLITPYLEAVMDAPMKDIIEQRKSEMEDNLQDLFFPAPNSYTMSGSDHAKPQKPDNEIDNENTERTKSNDGNTTPSPSD